MTKATSKSKALKVSWNKDETKGRLRMKIFGMSKMFNSPTMGRVQIIAYVDRVREDIKRFESVSIDPTTNTHRYPFTTWQIAQIEQSGHDLLPEIRMALTENHTFREMWDRVAGNVAKKMVAYRIEDVKFMDTDMSLITGNDIAELFETISTEWKSLRGGGPLAKGSLVVIQSTFRLAFKTADQSGWLVNNPFHKDSLTIDKHSAKGVSHGKKTYWTAEQVEFMLQAARLLDANGSNDFGKFELFLRWGLFTGQRISDIADAQWDRFSFLDTVKARYEWKMLKQAHEREWAITDKYLVRIDDFSDDPTLLAMLQNASQESSNRFEKIIKLANKLRTDSDIDFSDDPTLQNASQESGFIFGGMSKDVLSNRFEKIIKLANKLLADSDINAEIDADTDPVEVIKGSPHIMRHTMVANVVSGTGGMWDVAQKRCGHASVKTTVDHYGDMMSGAIKQALKLKNAWIIEQRDAAQARVNRVRLRVVV